MYITGFFLCQSFNISLFIQVADVTHSLQQPAGKKVCTSCYHLVLSKENM